MRKNKAFLLSDALMGFVIFSLIITLLYSGYISLIKAYSNSQLDTFERIKQWEEEMEVH